jgi:hypothetical protein
MATAAQLLKSESCLIKANFVRRQLGRWGDGFVAIFGSASVFFIGTGTYAALKGPATPDNLQTTTTAFFIGMSLAALAMLWRCVHASAEIAIELLTEIASKVNSTPPAPPAKE